MAVLLLGTLVLLCMICTGPITAQNPGVQVRITDRGVREAAQVGVDRLSSYLLTERFEDIHNTIKGVDVWITGFRIKSFKKPSTEVSPSLGVTVNGRNAAAAGNGNIRAKFGILSSSGTFTMSAIGISLSMSAKPDASASGQPTIRTTQCVTRIGDLDIDISGSLFSHVFNWLIAYFEDDLKEFLQGKICDFARTIVDEDWNDKLSNFEVMRTYADTFQLDYRLIRAPRFAAGNLDIYLKGEFRSKVNPVRFTATPAPFPIRTDNSRMVNVWVSDYLLSSWAFAAFKEGLLQYQISTSEILYGALRVTCPGTSLCIGTLFPELQDKYPNGEGVFSIKATRVPSIHISSRGISLNWVGEIDLKLHANRRVYTILVLSLTLKMSVNVYTDDNVLWGSVTSSCPVVTVKEAFIDNIPPNTFQAIYDEFVREPLVGYLNKIGASSIDIPHIMDTHYSRTLLDMNEGYLRFAGDVIWAPESSSTPVTPRPRPRSSRQQQAPCYNPDLLNAGRTGQGPGTSSSTTQSPFTSSRRTRRFSPSTTTRPTTRRMRTRSSTTRRRFSSSRRSSAQRYMGTWVVFFLPLFMYFVVIDELERYFRL